MIIVDFLAQFPGAKKPFHNGSCHLTSTQSEEELHEFAAKIGLKREWFQLRNNRNSHYDLTPGKRKLAIREGAQSRTSREMLRYGYNGTMRTGVLK